MGKQKILRRTLVGLSIMLFLFPQLTEGQSNCSSIDFTANKTLGCKPEVVKFYAQGHDPTSQNDWIIANDTFPDRDTLVKVFLTPGKYDVSLVNTNNSKECVVQKKNFLDIGKKPEIKFTTQKQNFCSNPDTVAFQGQNSAVTKWNWYIGNNSYKDAGPNFEHAFQSTGYQSISVEVTNSSGCTNFKTFDSAVRIHPDPSINFTASQKQGNPPFKVDFQAQFNSSEQSINSIAWSLPGANPDTSNQTNPQDVNYTNQGTYDVTLSAITDKGCQLKESKKQFIVATDSIGLAFDVKPKVVCPGESVKLINKTQSMANNSLLQWKVDGSSVGSQFNDTLVLGSLSQGNHDVTLVYEKFGNQQTLKKQNAFQVQQFDAEFSVDNKRNCKPNDPIAFNNNSTGAGVNLSYQWIFSDTSGNQIGQSNSKAPQFNFNQYGNFNVELVASDNQYGCKDTFQKEEIVQIHPFPREVELYPHTVCRNQPVKLTYPKDSFNSSDSLNFIWKVYDTSNTQLLHRLEGEGREVKLPDTGTYHVRLHLTSDNGCGDTLAPPQGVGKIHVTTPTADFKGPQLICSGEQAFFEEDTDPSIKGMRDFWTLTNTNDTSIQYSDQKEKYRPTINEPGIYDVDYLAKNDSFCSSRLTKDNYLSVSGVKADFTHQTISHCLPYQAKVEANVTANYHFQNASDTLNYQWDVQPSGGVTINNPDSSATQITASQEGCYTVSLTIINSDTCQEVITKQNLFCTGPIARFSMPQDICHGNDINVTQNSDYAPLNYKWSSNNEQNVDFLSSDTAQAPSIQFTDSGQYDIELVVENQYGCKDTSSKSINVQRVVADFSTDDNINYCAPASVDFDINSTNATSQVFKFGDGKTTSITGDNIQHVYNQNSGGIQNDGFDNTLIAQNNLGCKDTLEKPSNVKVVGPVPDFSVSKKQGCEPLNVEFTNKSKNVSQLYMDYGNNSNLDSGNFKNHTYTINNSSKNSQSYKPVLIAIDENNCNAIYEMPDSITVKRSPDSKFSISNKKGCEPLFTDLNDQSSHQISRKWDLDNDGQIEDTMANPSYELNHGNYDVKLTTTAANGCTDTLVKKQGIQVFEKPEADFRLKSKQNCPGSNVRFIHQIKTNTRITNVHWDFGDPSNQTDTSGSLRPAPYTYKKPGTFTPSLQVTNKKGCKDTVVKENIVELPKAIQEEPSITHVTNSNDQATKIQWEKSGAKEFKYYELSMHTNSIQDSTLLVSGQRNKTSYKHFVDQKLENKAGLGYSLHLIDKCENETKPSNEHQISFLKASSKGNSAIKLDWSKYKGWEKVDHYSVHRMDDNQSLQIGQTDEDQTSFVDSNLCGGQQCYVVKAHHENGVYVSQSNEACANTKPQSFNAETLSPNISVFDNESIILQWENAGDVNVSKYIIDKYEEGKGWYPNYTTTKISRFEDRDVDVNEHSYKYRVRVQDQCDHVSKASNARNTILLETNMKNDNVHLNWNKLSHKGYEAKEYEVQLENEDGRFKTLKKTTGGQTKFVDKKDHMEVDSAYCYRIAAETKDDNTTNLSNTSCVLIPSEVYVPNAFSPNGDGLNDKFRITTTSLQKLVKGEVSQYELEIYNRWGNKLFSTTDPDEGWDGRKDGTKNPQGTYLYKVEAQGYDNKNYYIEGQLQLIR